MTPLFIEVVDILHYALKYSELALFAMPDVSAYEKLHGCFDSKMVYNLHEKKFVLFYTCIEQDAMKTQMHPESVK